MDGRTDGQAVAAGAPTVEAAAGALSDACAAVAHAAAEWVDAGCPGGASRDPGDRETVQAVIDARRAWRDAGEAFFSAVRRDGAL